MAGARSATPFVSGANSPARAARFSDPDGDGDAAGAEPAPAIAGATAGLSGVEFCEFAAEFAAEGVEAGPDTADEWRFEIVRKTNATKTAQSKPYKKVLFIK